MKALGSLAELEELMRQGAALGDEQARVKLLCDHFVQDPKLMLNGLDPFSAAYRDQVVGIHAYVSGRDGYRPERDELIPIDPVARARKPSIYADGGSRHLGTFLEAIGQILQIADLSPGQRVLEYGAGDGQIALALARMGCDVTVVDIEERYLEAIRLQSEPFGFSVRRIHGDFFADVGPQTFDLVLFFEAFHHALDHQRLLRRLHEITAPSSRLLFAGEPIIPKDDYWAFVVPFPWGLRLDALSLQAVKNYGWMELGYQEQYFLEVLRRTGWTAERRVSPTNGRGTCYVASKWSAEAAADAAISAPADVTPKIEQRSVSSFIRRLPWPAAIRAAVRWWRRMRVRANASADTQRH